MKKISLISFLVSFILLFSVVSNAQQDNAKNKAKIPNLTEEQKEDINKIRADNKTKNQKIRENNKPLLKKHGELMREKEANMSAINSNLKNIADNRLEIAKNIAQMHQDIRALLDNDQRDFYDKNLLAPNKKQKGKKQNDKKQKGKK